jgi:hypothetical protein
MKIKKKESLIKNYIGILKKARYLILFLIYFSEINFMTNAIVYL